MAKEHPTNQQVVKLLEQILRELDDVKKQQQQLAAGLDEIRRSMNR